ncbi:TetR/AcrR family transcriptional regulator [Pseudarthrobacter oxydans]|uniref:TetR/AcrR family transcriptional regulator n=1 Tax=Pseudarthrobacter oxydans TaxID=1671 RepID=UPI00382CE3BD
MTDQREPGLRQRKQAATALTIERSAVALVQEHGFQAVTVDMICAASGVSQRTFFNYFKTKDQAILGAEPGRLDERRVREFLASDSPDLLAGILDLLATLAPVGTEDRALAADRMGIISRTPALMQKEIVRLSDVYEELKEVLYLRLRRSAPANEPSEETRTQSALIAHLIPGILRFTLEQQNSSNPGHPHAGTEQLLAGALQKLLPAAPAGETAAT